MEVITELFVGKPPKVLVLIASTGGSFSECVHGADAFICDEADAEFLEKEFYTRLDDAEYEMAIHPLPEEVSKEQLRLKIEEILAPYEDEEDEDEEDEEDEN